MCECLYRAVQGLQSRCMHVASVFIRLIRAACVSIIFNFSYKQLCISFIGLTLKYRQKLHTSPLYISFAGK